jgi:hypothetical protein
MRRSIAAAAVAAGVLAGAAGATVLSPVGLVGAAETPTESGARECMPGRGAGGAPLATVAELLDLSIDELRTALREGQTIADLAGARGVSVESLVDSLVAAMDERLATAVEAGRLTQERADQMRANADERLTAMVNGEHEPRAGRRHGMGRFVEV